MRVVYLDETGHSFKEPHAAVAGVLLDPDQQWAALAQSIDHLKKDVPEQFRNGFFFHASDLFGGGKWRNTWPDEDRWHLLEKLVALPRLLHVPIVLGFTAKPEERDEPGREGRYIHAMAYIFCLKAADRFMREQTPPNEIAMVVAEERAEARNAIRAAHNLASSKQLLQQFFGPELCDGLPITRIKAPPAFASKEEEVLLQMADACAWVFQRHLSRRDMSERFTDAMFGEFAQPAQLSAMRTLAANDVCFWWANPEAFSVGSLTGPPSS
jgi:hypothetical protein